MADKLTPYNTGHFHVPNEVANAADVPLTDKEFRIYIMICRFASSYKTVFPSYAKIREHCAIGSNATVRNALNGLVEKGLLHVRARKRKGTNARSSNVYTLLKPRVDRKNTDENECPVCGCSTVEHEQKKPAPDLENTGLDGIGCTVNEQGLYSNCTKVVQSVNKGCTVGVEEIKRENKYSNKSVSQSSGQDVTDEEIEKFESEIKSQIDYEELSVTHPDELPLVDEFINVIADVEFTSSPTVRVGRGDKERNHVKKQFKKLTYDAIVRCLRKYESQPNEIKNKPMYIRTMLYQAPMETEAEVTNLYASSRGGKES
jgi:hypothetical protein